MREHAVRLHKGDDLKKAMEEYCRRHNINTAVVLSGVGCLLKARIRMADASRTMQLDDKDFEIVSLTGTISNGEAHVHICLTDEWGNACGGHLLEDCIVNTTVELVLGELETIRSERVFDDNTGYDEIVFREV